MRNDPSAYEFYLHSKREVYEMMIRAADKEDTTELIKIAYAHKIIENLYKDFE